MEDVRKLEEAGLFAEKVAKLEKARLAEKEPRAYQSMYEVNLDDPKEVKAAGGDDPMNYEQDLKRLSKIVNDRLDEIQASKVPKEAKRTAPATIEEATSFWKRVSQLESLRDSRRDKDKKALAAGHKVMKSLDKLQEKVAQVREGWDVNVSTASKVDPTLPVGKDNPSSVANPFDPAKTEKKEGGKETGSQAPGGPYTMSDIVKMMKQLEGHVKDKKYWQEVKKKVDALQQNGAGDAAKAASCNKKACEGLEPAKIKELIGQVVDSKAKAAPGVSFLQTGSRRQKLTLRGKAAWGQAGEYIPGSMTKRTAAESYRMGREEVLRRRREVKEYIENPKMFYAAVGDDVIHNVRPLLEQMDNKGNGAIRDLDLAFWAADETIDYAEHHQMKVPSTNELTAIAEEEYEHPEQTEDGFIRWEFAGDKEKPEKLPSNMPK